MRRFRRGCHRSLVTEMQGTVDQDKILVFDSNFECGNLDRVSVVSLEEYNLFLNVDTNTKGHSQWFYFAVTNTHKGHRAVFNILNCTKPVPLFKSGMKPIAFSEIEYQLHGVGWLADTIDAFYGKNDITKSSQPVSHAPDHGTEEGHTEEPAKRTYYTLSFSYTFKHSCDRVYFAYARPYSVSMHCNLLRGIQERLISTARHITLLDQGGLQKRIREFVQEGEKREAVTPTTKGQGAGQGQRTRGNEEDEFKVRRKKPRASRTQMFAQCRSSVTNTQAPECDLLAPEVLEEYKDSHKESRVFGWLKGQDFQIETESLIYRQETLSHSFSGFPVELVTITGPKYLSLAIRVAAASIRSSDARSS
jgi:hypothetical protein